MTSLHSSSLCWNMLYLWISQQRDSWVIFHKKEILLNGTSNMGTTTRLCFVPIDHTCKWTSNNYKGSHSHNSVHPFKKDVCPNHSGLASIMVNFSNVAVSVYIILLDISMASHTWWNLLSFVNNTGTQSSTCQSWWFLVTNVQSNSTVPWGQTRTFSRLLSIHAIFMQKDKWDARQFLCGSLQWGINLAILKLFWHAKS